MGTATLTLTDFLLARIAEDEAAADQRAADAPIHQVGCFYYENDITPTSWTSQHCDCEPEAKARVLAECKAKRRIVALHAVRIERDWVNPLDGPAYQTEEHYCEMCDWVPDACETVKALATVYADHPDFRDEWRP